MYCPFMTTSVEQPQTSWIPDDKTFGARLALVRQRMGWGNVKEAAEQCGVAVESWRRWERDGRQPHNIQAQVEKISVRTGCDFDWLLRGPRATERPNVRLSRSHRSVSRHHPKRQSQRRGAPRAAAQTRPVSAIPPNRRRPMPVRKTDRPMSG